MADGFSYGSGEEPEEKRSLVGTALSRSRATTRSQKRLIESELFEPLLANLLAFVKAFQRKHKAENPPPKKPGKEPVRIPKDQMDAIVKNHDDMLRALSRSYLAIVIEFSDHNNLLADQNFFRWLHAMLCQFIENSLEKNDTELMETVQLELHRIFQGDRFNVEAKRPEQIIRKHKRKIGKWALMRHVPKLSRELVRNSPIVGHLLPSPAERINKVMKDLEAFSASNNPRKSPLGRAQKMARPQSSMGFSRPGTAPQTPELGPAGASPPRAMTPSSATLRPGAGKMFVTAVSPTRPSTAPARDPARSNGTAFGRAWQSPQSPPRKKKLPAHGGWEARVHALSLLEKKSNWKVKQPLKWVDWQSART